MGLPMYTVYTEEERALHRPGNVWIINGKKIKLVKTKKGVDADDSGGGGGGGGGGAAGPVGGAGAAST